jgi:hypothetical protein
MGVRYASATDENATDFQVRGSEENQTHLRVRTRSRCLDVMFIKAAGPLTLLDSQLWQGLTLQKCCKLLKT